MRGTVASAPTARVLDILELLVQPGTDGLRFSDIAKALDLTQATTHAILKTLTDRGWVVRDPSSKAYTPGPALAAVASRLSAVRPQVRAASAAAGRLSADLGYPASVVERVGDALMITAFEGAGPAGAGMAPGDRIPYAPPFGVAFAAWDSPAGQQAWIERASAADPLLTQRLRDLLAQTRERGFDVDWTTPALAGAAKMMWTLPSAGLPPQVRLMMDRLLAEFTSIGLLGPSGATQPVATIAAPVFAADRVALIVSVHPLQPLAPGEIGEVGRRLIEETQPLHLA
jgi:DNA-binding IclR family transcriptional regulator